MLGGVGGVAWPPAGELRLRSIRRGRLRRQTEPPSSARPPHGAKPPPASASFLGTIRTLGQQSAVKDPAKLSVLRSRLMQAGFYNREAPVIYLEARAAVAGRRHRGRHHGGAADRSAARAASAAWPSPVCSPAWRIQRPRPGAEGAPGQARAAIFRWLPRPSRSPGGLGGGGPQPGRCRQPGHRRARSAATRTSPFTCASWFWSFGPASPARKPGRPSPIAWESMTRASSPPCCARLRKWAPAWARRSPSSRQDMRSKRMLRAEEKALALSAKLTVPLILFIFPCLLGSLMLPAAARLMHRLRGAPGP